MKTLGSILLFSLFFRSDISALERSVSFDQISDLTALPEKARAVPAPVIGETADETPGFCVFNGPSGSPLADAAAFKSVVGDGDAIYAGETHDQKKDHNAQLETLKALGEARGEKIVVGFEMLNLTLQPILDEYAAGTISEEEFLIKADWKKEWGFDFDLYKPLFDFVREHKLAALALNLPRKVVSKIARVGLDGLSPEEKQYLPARVEITQNEAYIAYLKESYDNHGKAHDPILGGLKKGMDEFTFEHYLEAMCAWNEAMGARLADFMNSNPGYAGMVVAGSGHIIYNAGIPASVASRTAGLRPVSFYPADAAACPAALPAEDSDLADYVWYINHSTTTAGVLK